MTSDNDNDLDSRMRGNDKPLQQSSTPTRGTSAKQKINGIFLLDKPEGYTSNKALQQVKSLFKAAKAGHTGNLDPLASGVLPICFGEATKFAGFLLEADKSYLVTAKLGENTDTGDADGKIIATKAVPVLTTEQLQPILLRFCGAISQLPPMYSALKYQGQPLYKLARKGVQVERKPRTITIYKIELLSLQDEYFTLQVHCSKGTYMRTLVEDIGAILDCGAHVTKLRRLLVGNYKIEDAITLPRLEEILASNNELAIKNLLLPTDSSVMDWPEIFLSSFAIDYLLKGQQIAANNAPAYGLVRLKAESNGQFIGIGEAVGRGMIAPKRLIDTRGMGVD